MTSGCAGRHFVEHGAGERRTAALGGGDDAEIGEDHGAAGAQSSDARMSRRNDTPVALNASTTRPRSRMRAMMAHGGGRLAGFRASSCERDHRHAARIQHRLVIERFVAGLRGDADTLAEIRKGQHGGRAPCSRRACLCRASRSRKCRERRRCSASGSHRRASKRSGMWPDIRIALCDDRAHPPRCRRARPLPSARW